MESGQDRQSSTWESLCAFDRNGEFSCCFFVLRSEPFARTFYTLPSSPSPLSSLNGKSKNRFCFFGGDGGSFVHLPTVHHVSVQCTVQQQINIIGVIKGCFNAHRNVWMWTHSMLCVRASGDSRYTMQKIFSFFLSRKIIIIIYGWPNA